MKRLFDIFCSSFALFVFSPLFIIVFVLIKLDNPGPALFVQRRVGIDDAEFSMYKFRTMVVGTPNVATDKLKNSQSYITKIGYYLRKYSIDELPQLLNILKGDMSIIGPRPALYNQTELRERRNKHRISSIRPGLSGWAQVNGRDDIPLSEKVKLDFFYLKKQSFWLDLKIIYMTLFSVSGGTGITATERKVQARG